MPDAARPAPTRAGSRRVERRCARGRRMVGRAGRRRSARAGPRTRHKRVRPPGLLPAAVSIERRRATAAPSADAVLAAREVAAEDVDPGQLPVDDVANLALYGAAADAFRQDDLRRG